MERSIGTLLILLLTGCTAATTRLPTCRAQPADSEVKSYTMHDPFPDEDAGPNTGTRPRVFQKPRTDSTKDYAARNLKAAYGYPQKMYSWGSPMPVSSNQYPVQPIWQTQPPSAGYTTLPGWQNQ
jgi:hypothetical protein